MKRAARKASAYDGGEFTRFMTKARYWVNACDRIRAMRARRFTRMALVTLATWAAATRMARPSFSAMDTVRASASSGAAKPPSAWHRRVHAHMRHRTETPPSCVSGNTNRKPMNTPKKWPEFGQLRPNFHPNWTQSGPESATIAPKSPESDRNWPNSANVGQHTAKFGQLWPGIERN